MNDRVEMLEAALDLMDEGVVLLDEQARVLFWNDAATFVTGYNRVDRLSRVCPEDLYEVDAEHLARTGAATLARARTLEGASPNAFAGAIARYAGELHAHRDTTAEGFLEKPALVAIHHHLGHSIPAMLRKVPLSNDSGERMGTVLLFHPVEELGALPHGDSGAGAGVEHAQADMEGRLDAAHHQWETNRVPYGLLWITVDQAASLRKSHGREACDSMLRNVEQTLIRGLRPNEVMGRWGDDDFLVLSHERTAELMVEHAQRLAGRTRTTDFRWWGDRMSLTVSVGVSQAVANDSLHLLLKRAQEAVRSSRYAGGNHVSEVKGR
jgi:diguanylate cyclase (GGDEF)-like protein